MFWNQEYAPSLGGVEIYTQNLAHKLAAKGHDVLVVSSHSNESFDRHAIIEGIPVHRFPFFQALTSRDHAAIFEIQKEVAGLRQRFRPDLVHINFTDASPFFYLRTKPRKDAAVVVFHSPLDTAPGGLQLGKTLAVQVGRLIAPSRFLASHLEEVLSLPEGKVEVIRNGVHEGRFLKTYEASSAEPVFVFAGRLVRDKGVQVLIEAFSKLTARHKAKLRIVGAGPERALLEEQISRMGLRDIIEFAGMLPQESLARCMAEAAAVVIPSIFSDPAPLVATEAALAGKAVIASKIGGLPEIVLHGETGLLVEPGDAGQLAGVMEKLLLEPETAKQYGKRARGRAIAEFTLTAMTEKYERLYQELLSDSLV